MSYEYSSYATEVSESIERGEWKSVPEVSEEKRRYQPYGKAKLHKYTTGRLIDVAALEPLLKRRSS